MAWIRVDFQSKIELKIKKKKVNVRIIELEIQGMSY